MTKHCMQSRRGEQGFTLVELAIVMIIIGLLIGGVLKGQELINNAQITSAVTQLRNVDIAISGFRDAYNAFPGDIQSADQRLPGCDTANTACNRSGDGNGQLDVAPGFEYDESNENFGVWAHLAASNFLQGVDAVSANTTLIRGDTAPATEIGDNSLLAIGYLDSLTTLDSAGSVAAIASHYMLITNAANGDVDSTTGLSMTPNAAQRVDTKLDDGAPNGGTVRAVAGSINSDTCMTANGNTGIYNEAAQANVCAIYIGVQG